MLIINNAMWSYKVLTNSKENKFFLTAIIDHNLLLIMGLNAGFGSYYSSQSLFNFNFSDLLVLMKQSSLAIFLF